MCINRTIFVYRRGQKMRWDCPYQVVDYCKRLKIKCNPLCKGCILQGKIDPVTGIFFNGIKMIDDKHKIKEGDCDDKVVRNRNVRD